MKKLEKYWRWYVPWLLLAAILSRWRQPVVPNKALDLLYWALHAVLYWLTTTAIEMASKVGAFFIVVCLLSPRWPLGQYGESSHPMAASSGF
jgi:hypothetical protein